MYLHCRSSNRKLYSDVATIEKTNHSEDDGASFLSYPCSHYRREFGIKWFWKKACLSYRPVTDYPTTAERGLSLWFRILYKDKRSYALPCCTGAMLMVADRTQCKAVSVVWAIDGTAFPLSRVSNSPSTVLFLFSRVMNCRSFRKSCNWGYIICNPSTGVLCNPL